MTTLNTPTTQTQCANILAALSAGRGVTPVDALIEFSCFRLAARIYDLRKAGHNIVTHWEEDGDKRWAIYHLLKEAA